ncbi:MAG: four-helix bundle copper-binding protein [Thiohalocapsa sp.]|jgi:Cys-rich four helix bundle protein (predicted Tat secretion target)
MIEKQFSQVEGHSAAQPTLSRRSLLTAAGAVGAALATGTSLGGDAPGHRHEDHAPKSPGVLNAVNDCVVKAQQCIAHCLVAFQEGDNSLADCARKVNEMLPICKAFSYQLAANSPYVTSLSAVCKQACEDCEDECRKHEDKHVECKDCAEACAQVVQAIETLSA